jgi:hypothetical protein
MGRRAVERVEHERLARRGRWPCGRRMVLRCAGGGSASTMGIGVQPHVVDAFDISGDPLPIEKMWDIVGLSGTHLAYVYVDVNNDKS